MQSLSNILESVNTFLDAAPYAKPLQALDAQICQLADVVGLPDDQFKIILTWILSLPFGYIQTRIRGAAVRNYYGLILGILFQYICVQKWVYLTLANTLVSYAMMRALGRKSAWPTAFVFFGVLLACHIYRYIYDFYGWRLDGTTAVMMMLCKITYVSFYYSNGKMQDLPSLAEYAGYIYFYPSATIGPVFPFQMYQDFVHERGLYQKIPSTVRASLVEAGKALAYLGAMQAFDSKYGLVLVKSELWENSNFFMRVLLLQVTAAVIRFKYFGGWKFGQAGVNAAGLSFNGWEKTADGKVTDRARFDGILTFDERFEFTISPVERTNMWNSAVQVWLKNVFYDTFSTKLKLSANLSLLGTFVLSGFWHGVHPVYYLTFLHWAIVSELGKQLYRARAKFEFIPNIVRTALGIFFHFTFVNYLGICMCLLDFESATKMFRDVYYVGTLLPLAGFIFFSVTKYGQRSGRAKSNNAGAAENAKKKE